MDPFACLLACDSCLTDAEFELAEDCFEQYREWRTKGGFEPQGVVVWGDKLTGDVAYGQLRKRYGTLTGNSGNIPCLTDGTNACTSDSQ